MACVKVSASSDPQTKDGFANGVGGGRTGVGCALFRVSSTEVRWSSEERELSLGKDSEKDTVVGVVGSVETLDKRGGAAVMGHQL